MVNNNEDREEEGKFLSNAINALRKPENLIKYSSLVILVLQYATQVLYLRWVNVRPGKREKFLYTVCVFFQEILKLTVCIILVTIQEKSIKKSLKLMYTEIFINWRDALKVCVPAGIYVIQNNLLYVAVANLSAAVYMVTYQLKILTTALFTVILLRRRLSLFQWLALLFLFGGIALVQVDQKEKEGKLGSKNEHQNLFIGVGAVLIACLLSGFAGIYFEKILKQRREVSVFLRNVQLAAISLLPATITIFAKDYETVKTKGFFVGFDLAVWGAIVFGAFGGLLVAVVIKFADNILKAFATSFAIVLACILSVILFNFSPGYKFIIGATLVIGAVFVYSLFPYKPKYIPAATEPTKTEDGAKDPELGEIEDKTEKDAEDAKKTATSPV
uniref:UDP-galactose translocator n=1 Tax=Syphacia muris TaxID=451379 RepID=A0A0N5ADV2_9BILA